MSEKAARELSPAQAAVAMRAEASARELALTGPDGLLKLFTKNVLETALSAEMTEHLGHERNQVESGRESTNVRNVSQATTVISDPAGEVEIDVPRDRERVRTAHCEEAATSAHGRDEDVLSLYARFMTPPASIPAAVTTRHPPRDRRR
jgi:putative transposase